MQTAMVYFLNLSFITKHIYTIDTLNKISFVSSMNITLLFLSSIIEKLNNVPLCDDTKPKILKEKIKGKYTAVLKSDIFTRNS